MGLENRMKKVLSAIHAEFLIEPCRSFWRKYNLLWYRWYHRHSIFEAWCIQNQYDKKELKKKTVVIFVLYRQAMVNGGFISIYNIAATSRRLHPDYAVVLCTGPGNPDIYAANNLFRNNEKIWRWGQVIGSIRGCAEKVFLHIPECYVEDFLLGLSVWDKYFLRSISDLRINILNQNIWLMPRKETIAKLYCLTKRITQTTAHAKYATQEMCNQYGLPLLRIGTYLPLDDYKRYNWAEKRNIVAYSPDENPMREEILAIIRDNLSGYELIEICNMTFMEYMDLIAKAKAVLTFGEGMDGYFIQPPKVGTVSFAVFNEDFFPAGQNWVQLETVFASYSEMKDKICSVMSTILDSKERYCECVQMEFNMLSKTWLTKEQYQSNIKRFYQDDFEYRPNGGM